LLLLLFFVVVGSGICVGGVKGMGVSGKLRQRGETVGELLLHKIKKKRKWCAKLYTDALFNFLSPSLSFSLFNFLSLFFPVSHSLSLPIWMCVRFLCLFIFMMFPFWHFIEEVYRRHCCCCINKWVAWTWAHPLPSPPLSATRIHTHRHCTAYQAANTSLDQRLLQFIKNQYLLQTFLPPPPIFSFSPPYTLS